MIWCRAELVGTVASFCKQGLRTVVLAYRIIEDSYGIDWDSPETVEEKLVCAQQFATRIAATSPALKAGRYTVLTFC